MASDDVKVGEPSLPALGRTRCYWAVMDSMMNFRYLDPVLQFHMQEQAAAMVGKNLVDFIHPEEKEAAKADFAKFRSSTTIFGSVTRCRYARTSHCRRILGAQNPETDTDGAAKYLDENWLACRVTASVVADNAVLTFFHALQDVDPQADNDDTNPNEWTNWCGPRNANLLRDYFMSYNQQMLEQAFDICQNESEEIEAKVTRIEQGTETAGAPTYVFQILDSNSGEIYFTWPPTKPTGYRYDKVLYGPNAEDRYSPNEYALLARGVIQKPRSNVAAETNCTKRFQSQHPILKDDQMTNIESVVVTYQALTFVCFQTGGILLNSKSVSMAPGLSNALKRKNDDSNEVDDATDEAIKRLRQATGEDGVSASTILGSFGQNGGDGTDGFPAMPSPTHAQFNQAWNPDVNDNSLQSPYYQSSTYPSVYSSMFQANVEDGGFMSGSTNIPPMPAPSQATGANNGLQNLAIASSSSYYSDYNPNGQYNQMGANGEDPSLQFIPRQRGEASGSGAEEASETPAQVIHRVRKNDKNRICTSCGTTNSPEWRKGPSGIKTLCNACGLRYSRAQARKAKKARKEEEAGGGGGNGGGASGTDTPNTPNFIPAPLQLPPGNGTFGNDSDGGHHSPYLSVGDYASQQILPPLPHTANSDGSQGNNSQDNNGDTQVPSSTHPGSTAPNYGGYGAFHGFTPYGEWSPASNGSFSQQQGQMPQQGAQGQ